MDESHHEKIEKLTITGEWFLRSLVHNQRENGTHLMISGNAGTGKTRVAKGIYRYVRSFGVDICFIHNGRHPMPLWIDWPDLAEQDKQDSFEDVMFEIDRSQFVVIDDVGSESDRFKNGIAASRLRRVLARLEQKWLLCTTNLSKTSLIESYDARVADRFTSFRWISLAGVPSYRSKL